MLDGGPALRPKDMIFLPCRFEEVLVYFKHRVFQNTSREQSMHVEIVSKFTQWYSVNRYYGYPFQQILAEHEKQGYRPASDVCSDKT